MTENANTSEKTIQSQLSDLAEQSRTLIFTNLTAAQAHLAEIETLLAQEENLDYRLQFHADSAIVANQLYQFERAEAHFEQALALVAATGNGRQQSEIYIDFAATLTNLQQLDRANDYLERAKKYLQSSPDAVLQARWTCREAYLWLFYNDTKRAAELFLLAETMLIELEQPSIKNAYFQTLVYIGFGILYDKTGDSLRSAQAYQRVVTICETFGLRARLAWHYLNIGKAYISLKDYDQAEQFFRAVETTQDDSSPLARAHAKANLGYCVFQKNRFAEALQLLDDAEQLYAHNRNDADSLSTVFHWKGLLFKALDREKKAKKHFAQALQYAAKANNVRQQAIVCKDIALLLATQHEYKDAYDYQVLHDKLVKQHYEQTSQNRLSEIELKYETERKRQESEMLRLQATSLQLKALRAQMNPHFMFNALNAIQHFVLIGDANLAGKYLAQFAKLMRQSLEYSELEIIALEDEIAFLSVYLEINKHLRFDERLTFQIEVDDDIEDDILGVPTMIIQPYLENAIEHGLRPLKGGNIRIHFSLIDDDTLRCTIEDNGVGRAQAKAMQDRNEYHLHHRSRGTNITEKRLEILNNNVQNNLFVQTIDLTAPTGTRVEITIPIVEMLH
jgi:two-component system, LytTR family, sensor kinase